MRKNVGFVVGVVFGIALVATCSLDTAPVGPDLGGVLDLAGGPGRDLSRNPFGDDLAGLGDLFPRFDIAGADAAGSDSMLFTATCNQTATRTVVYSTYTSTTTYYFAEVAVTGLLPSDSPHVTATGCNFAYYGTSAGPPTYGACPSGTGITSCSDSGYALPAGTCQSLGAFVAPGKVIVNCGYHLTYSGISGELGSLPANVYVRLN